MIYRTKGFVPTYAKESGMVAYFQTNPPALWKNNAASRTAFAEAYGAQNLFILDALGVIPENTDPSWVRTPYDRIEDAGPRLIDPATLTGPVPQATEFEKYTAGKLEEIFSLLEAIKVKLGI